MAYHKCIVHLLSFEPKTVSLEIDYTSKHDIELRDYKGAKSPVKYENPSA